MARCVRCTAHGGHGPAVACSPRRLHRTRKLVTAVTVRLEKRTVKSGARVESVCTMGNEGVELGCGARDAILAHLTLAGTSPNPNPLILISVGTTGATRARWAELWEALDYCCCCMLILYYDDYILRPHYILCEHFTMNTTIPARWGRGGARGSVSPCGRSCTTQRTRPRRRLDRSPGARRAA